MATNGIISLQQPFTHHVPYSFPSEFTFISSAFLLAPFWSDVDIRQHGSVKYEIHSGSSNSLLSQVNNFISNYTETEFCGTWMLVAEWNQVPQYPGFSATSVGAFSFS